MAGKAARVGWCVALATVATIVAIILMGRKRSKDRYYPGMAMYSYPSYSAYGDLNAPPTFLASAAQGRAPPG